MDERKELGYDLLGHKERKKLIEALEEGTDGEPTQQEKDALISWALQSRLNQEFISLVQKGILKIRMDEDHGFLVPDFYPTKIGQEISELIHKQNAELEEEGDEILREMIKDMKSPDEFKE